MRLYLAGAALLIAALIIGLWSYAIHWQPSVRDYPLQGIDVSHYQGKVDWTVLPAQGVDFAYIKATEGGDRRDDRFLANWNGARQAGLRRGAYHFFTLCRPGADQAANFIATVPLDPAMLPPVVDLEFGGNCAARPAPAILFAQLDIFLRAVEARFGQPVTLYLTREFDQAYGVSTRVARPLWLRRLLFEPAWSPRPWSIWQASSFRRVHGIKGQTDWNVMHP